MIEDDMVDISTMKMVGKIFAAVIVIGVPLLMFGCPTYNVWHEKMNGEAMLAKASQTRQIQIAQAQGEKEAAVLRAEAIKTIGKAAQDFPQYRTQEFIGAFAEAIKEGKIHQIIYVPTEANIPITEAGRIATQSTK